MARRRTSRTWRNAWEIYHPVSAPNSAPPKTCRRSRTPPSPAVDTRAFSGTPRARRAPAAEKIARGARPRTRETEKFNSHPLDTLNVHRVGKKRAHALVVHQHRVPVRARRFLRRLEARQKSFDGRLDFVRRRREQIVARRRPRLSNLRPRCVRRRASRKALRHRDDAERVVQASVHRRDPLVVAAADASRQPPRERERRLEPSVRARARADRARRDRDE
mmetsp:Transcript_2841/g.10919  ORF Transcript_2841/g.10919 Transcript_2841/m.10919 type:complete len:220 (+) Transcript_2841:206-865(+)